MEDVSVVMEAAGSHRAAIWASGDNGLLGMLFAASHPDRAIALALYEAAPSVLRRDDMPWLMTEVEYSQLEDAATWGTREFCRRAFAFAGPSAIGDRVEEEWYTRWVRLSGTPGSYRAALEYYKDTDVRDILPSIHVPTMILRRKDSPGEARQTAQYLADHIEHARFVELPGEDLMHWLGDADSIVDELEEFFTGARHASHDRVLTTLLISDIVSSTERISVVGDRRWAELLEEHNRVVRTLLARFGGQEVDTTGDGFLATFDGPARAVKCGQEMHAAMSSLGLRIRVSCHTGEIERSGSRVRGMAVHAAARVLALAEAGEVLVTSTVKDLVAGAGLIFEDRGTHRLKGVPDSWQLFRVADR